MGGELHIGHAGRHLDLGNNMAHPAIRGGGIIGLEKDFNALFLLGRSRRVTATNSNRTLAVLTVQVRA